MVIIDGNIKRASTIVSILAESPPIILAKEVKEKMRINFLKCEFSKIIFILSLFMAIFNAEKLYILINNALHKFANAIDMMPNLSTNKVILITRNKILASIELIATWDALCSPWLMPYMLNEVNDMPVEIIEISKAICKLGYMETSLFIITPIRE